MLATKKLLVLAGSVRSVVFCSFIFWENKVSFAMQAAEWIEVEVPVKVITIGKCSQGFLIPKKLLKLKSYRRYKIKIKEVTDAARIKDARRK